MSVEQLHKLGKIRQRPSEPVDLVDHDHIDPARLHLGEQPPQGRPLQAATRVAAVVVSLRSQAPALMSLALDVGFRGLALVVERVEFLLEPLLGRLAGVDGTAQRLGGCEALHDSPPPVDRPSLSRRPKKRGPFQRVPVIARATSDRLV